MPDKKMIKPVIVSGMCKCGHSWEAHHISYIMNPEALKQLAAIAPNHPPCFPDECLAHGSNEVGGMKYNDETGEWEDHCHRYEDVEDID